MFVSFLKPLLGFHDLINQKTMTIGIFFIENHPRNIPVRFRQILPSGLGENDGRTQ